MTRQRTLRMKFLVRGVLVLCVAALGAVITVAAPRGQREGTGQPPRNSLAATVPVQANAISPPLFRRLLPGAANVLVSKANSQSKKAAIAAAPESGNSLFRRRATYDSGGGLAWSIAVRDLNGDGKPDLVVVNYGVSTYGSVGVLLGNGDGTFQPSVVYASGGGGPSGIAVDDVNGDGKPDLVVANQGCPGIGSDCLGVLLGNGDGTFQPVVIYADGCAGAVSGEGIFIPIMIADVNGDGKPDLVVVCQTNTTDGDALVGVLLGNGDGTFKPVVMYDAGGFAAFSGVLADVNGDGKPDLIVLNCGPSGLTACPSSQATVGVLLGNGDGTFQPVKKYSTGGWGSFFSPVLVADVNRDGKPDILVGNACPNNCSPFGDGSFATLLGNGDGTFQGAVTYDSGGGDVEAMAIADLNGDGKPDLVLASGGVWLGNGDGTFLPANIYAPSGGTHQVFLTDLNGDGKLDLIGVNGTSSSADVRLGNGDGTFQALQTFALGGSQWSWATVADLNGDGRPDLLSANWCAVICMGEEGVVGVLLNGSSATKSATATTLVSSLNPSVYGQKVVFTATVTTSGSVPPTGKVSFKWSGYTLGSATLNASGVATLTRSNLNVDTYPLTAVYVGDASNHGSTSTVVNQVVTRATSSATLTSSPNPSTSGQAVTFTATIKSPTVTPTGPVTFAVGTTVLGTAQLSGGKATFTTSTLAVGSTKVTATYYGDSNIAKSSASVTQSVH